MAFMDDAEIVNAISTGDSTYEENEIIKNSYKIYKERRKDKSSK